MKKPWATKKPIDFCKRNGSVITRREFLKTQIKGVVWMFAASSGLWLPRNSPASNTCDVSVVNGKAGPATRAAVDLLGGMKQFVKPGSKVVIKPNMSFPKGQKYATNTDIDVVMEIATMCLEAKAEKISIIDNPLGKPKPCIAEIKQACDTLKPGMVQAVTSSSKFKEVQLTDSWFGFNETDVMKSVLEADVLIAVPKAKVHHASGVTLSMKGMMGLIYDRMTMHFNNLNESIVTLVSYLKPQLVVVDASRVLATSGPRGPGRIIDENKIIASTDMVAADATTVNQCSWFKGAVKADQIEHIKLAHKAGIGRMDLENLNIKEISI